MISRRNYVAMLLMMCVLLFMVQLSQILKEKDNNYDYNKYSADNLPDRSNEWTSVYYDYEDIKELTDNNYVVYYGEKDTVVGKTVYQWCTYTKRNLYATIKIQKINLTKINAPEFLLIDSQYVDVCANISIIEEFAKAGTDIIFCNLPSVEDIRNCPSLMNLLGIEQIKEDETVVEGYQLFSGFFIGGEALYKKEDDRGQNLMDFSLTLPWFITGKGTKTYMVGLKDYKTINREDFPRVLWRNTYGESMVCAINGDFCDTVAGMGILDSFAYECKNYILYPVMNSQSVIVADYPTLANENNDIMKDIYNRSNDAVLRDIVLPGLMSMTSRNDMKVTCFIQTKYDYTTDSQPSGKQFKFYLTQLKEADAEAGRSLDYFGYIPIEEKAKLDDRFYESMNFDYRFGAAYVHRISDDLKEALRNKTILDTINTVSCVVNKDEPLISYFTDDTTLLVTTGDARDYSFMTDFKIRSMITALGYSNLLLDLHNVMWPMSEDDHWQNYYERVVSNINTFYSKYNYFDQLTMSTADVRARTFLNVSYNEQREDNVIRLSTVNGVGSYFIFRTHGEKIKEIKGGEYKELGEDIYMLKLISDEVLLTVEPSYIMYNAPAYK